MRDDKGDKDMNLTSEKIDVKNSLIKAMKEVKEVREGEKPKRSWRNMVTRIRGNLEK